MKLNVNMNLFLVVIFVVEYNSSECIGGIVVIDDVASSLFIEK
jgi:hypothetical protein